MFLLLKEVGQQTHSPNRFLKNPGEQTHLPKHSVSQTVVFEVPMHCNSHAPPSELQLTHSEFTGQLSVRLQKEF